MPQIRKKLNKPDKYVVEKREQIGKQVLVDTDCQLDLKDILNTSCPSQLFLSEASETPKEVSTLPMVTQNPMQKIHYLSGILHGQCFRVSPCDVGFCISRSNSQNINQGTGMLAYCNVEIYNQFILVSNYRKLLCHLSLHIHIIRAPFIISPGE